MEFPLAEEMFAPLQEKYNERCSGVTDACWFLFTMIGDNLRAEVQSWYNIVLPKCFLLNDKIWWVTHNHTCAAHRVHKVCRCSVYALYCRHRTVISLRGIKICHSQLGTKNVSLICSRQSWCFAHLLSNIHLCQMDDNLINHIANVRADGNVIRFYYYTIYLQRKKKHSSL